MPTKDPRPTKKYMSQNTKTILITDAAGFKGPCIAIVDPAKKESIEKSIKEKYLAKFLQYRCSYKVFSKSDDWARFVEDLIF